ncbi:MAG TPA: ABC transporter ATP-binding protein [Anaerolineae bacterium]|nr:ABC transporter ATP-binding protein [Anaerolineae bacterium]
MQTPVLEIEDLKTYFRVSNGTNKALDGISLTIREGETLGIVGRSGSGKSVLARSIMGLVRDPGYIAGGHIRFRGQELVGIDEQKLNALRGKDIALIVSSPRSRLNPLLTVGTQLENVVLSREGISRKAAHDRAVQLLTSVSIADPKRVASLLPQELSGGMCQRVVIAMALSHSPRLLLADEPTAGLDVTVQRQVLELMLKLVRDTGSALLLMTRDLGIVAHYCERVAVLMDGHIVEEQPVRNFFKHPQHPHSAYLLQVAFASHGESEVG